jgi:hypothetical protein
MLPEAGDNCDDRPPGRRLLRSLGARPCQTAVAVGLCIKGSSVNGEERVSVLYERFSVSRPKYLPEEHWQCVEVEAGRLWRSLEAKDPSQALNDIKCLVESVARIVLEIDGTPADPSAPFDSLVARAHTLLAGQPGHELANQSPFGQLATQASKIVRNLSVIRNEYGGGHGRARKPDIFDEMIDLALDGGLLWTRWALRRIGYFSEGRPSVLIRDLEQEIFHSGTLQRRLAAANLPSLKERYQRSIGIAVGRRVMQGTFVVRWDGLEPCLESDDLNIWPRDYRIGLAYGLWFDSNDHLTLMTESVTLALMVLEPVRDCAEDLAEWVDRIAATRTQGPLGEDWGEAFKAENFAKEKIPLRPPDERPALVKLAKNIDASPF